VEISNFTEACVAAAIWGLITAIAFRYGTTRFNHKDLPKPTILKVVLLTVFLGIYFLAIDFNHIVLAIFAFPIYFVSFYWLMKNFPE
jgi:hypothetical protein